MPLHASLRGRLLIPTCVGRHKLSQRPPVWNVASPRPPLQRLLADAGVRTYSGGPSDGRAIRRRLRPRCRSASRSRPGTPRPNYRPALQCVPLAHRAKSFACRPTAGLLPLKMRLSPRNRREAARASGSDRRCQARVRRLPMASWERARRHVTRHSRGQDGYGDAVQMARIGATWFASPRYV